MQGTVLMLVALSGLGCHNKLLTSSMPRRLTDALAVGVMRPFTPTTLPRRVFHLAMQVVTAAAMAVAATAAAIPRAIRACYSGGHGGHHGCGLLAKIFGCCGWKSHHSELLRRRLRRMLRRLRGTAAATADWVTGPATADTSRRSLAMPCSSITRRTLARSNRGR